MKKKLVYYILPVLFFALYSCESEEFFEKTNPPEQPWLTVSEFERAAISPYNLAFNSGWGNFFGNERLVWDCTSDITYLLPNTDANIPYNHFQFRWTDQPMDKATSAFDDMYKSVGICNSGLDFYYDNNEDPYPNATHSDKENNVKRIAGELHFMRAYSYWLITSFYCPPPQTEAFETERLVPLRTTLPLSLEEANNPYYAPTKEIFDTMLVDLKKAKNMLPERFESGIHHESYQYGRATKYAASAMLAKVYFLSGEESWDLALEELDMIINSGEFSLDQDPIEAFNRSDGSIGNEVIFYAAYFDPTRGDCRVLTSMNKTHYTATNGGRGENYSRCPWDQFAMSHQALKKIGWMDDNLNETEEALNDKRYKQLYYRFEPVSAYTGEEDPDPAIYETQYSHIEEPMVWGDKYFRGPDGRNSNVPVIRLAEIYLTRAIINFKKGNISSALADVNIVRQRAGLEALTELTEENIHNERIKELAFEGDRIRYLQALKMPIGPGDRVDDSGTPVADITFPYEKFYWRIPQREMDYRDGESTQ